jgi:aryl-alcohol dehydrogenase-like predicted oxidoreductase
MSKISNNKLILGTVQMGLSYGINNKSGKISLQNSIEILEYAYDSGIEILDSAAAYGNAHEVIGAFHEKHPEKRFKIITKLPHETNMNITEKVDEYLNELRVDQLDALLFHSFSTYKSHLDDFEVLRQLKADEKTRQIGVSVYTNEELETVLSNDDIDIIQLPFNLFDNVNLRGDLLKIAKSKGKTIHTRSALLQGLFFKDVSDNAKIVQNLNSELQTLTKISRTHKIPISKLALSYCLIQSNIDNVLIGVDSIEQLQNNLQAVNYDLKQNVIDEINTIKIKNLDLLNPSLWN